MDSSGRDDTDAFFFQLVAEGGINAVCNEAVYFIPGGSDAQKSLAFLGGVCHEADRVSGFHHGLLYLCLLQVGAVDAGFGVASSSEKIDVGIDLGEVQLGDGAYAAHDITAEGTAQHHQLNVFF